MSKGTCCVFIEVINLFSLTFVRSLCTKGLPLEMLQVGCSVPASPSLQHELLAYLESRYLVKHLLCMTWFYVRI